MVDNFLDLKKCKPTCPRSSIKKINMKKEAQSTFIIELQETSDKEKVSKAARGNNILHGMDQR